MDHIDRTIRGVSWELKLSPRAEEDLLYMLNVHLMLLQDGI